MPLTMRPSGLGSAALLENKKSLSTIEMRKSPETVPVYPPTSHANYVDAI
jgi:hypothetical protein